MQRLLPAEAAALREATSPSPSAHYVRIHLSQRERPWQRDEVCVEDCQGLSLWESCQSRQALTERARTMRDQREQTEGVIFEEAGKTVRF